MLAQLTINNFAIVRELEIDFQNGMTVVTGETGAGKSIAIDALNLCLGGRADPGSVRNGANRTDICAHFILTGNPLAQSWLQENQLDDNNECLLRRVITHDGRSRAFINGTAVPLSQLRELGQYLIQIHGQHTHQQLLKLEHQRRILDAHSDQPALLASMQQAYQQWRQYCQALTLSQQQRLEREARHQLLQYQLKELDDFAPITGEYQQLEEQHKKLANTTQLLDISQQTLSLLSGDEENNLQQLLNSAKKQVTNLLAIDNQLVNVLERLEDATIHLREAEDELHDYSQQLSADPQQLYELEQRLSRQITLARKHHIAPEDLPTLHQQLAAEAALLEQQDNEYITLEEQIADSWQHALQIAKQLHQQRCRTALELSKQLTDRIQTLSMQHGKCTIQVDFQPDHLTAEGADRIEFLVTTNPGQPLQPLTKIVSGGELSRIALAIQLISAQKMETPTLIFDEVDVGISGSTAAVVGALLRQLGESTQVICITHLPQVAGNGHHHFYVNKQTNGEVTETLIYALNRKNRLQELARLLAGSKVTANTLANAKELLVA